MVSTFGIFVISGLGLKRSQAVQALSSWQAALFGFISILLVTPLAGLAALRLPLHPPELAFGLAVFCCMPCTLSSGVSLTQVTALLTSQAWREGCRFLRDTVQLCHRVSCEGAEHQQPLPLDAVEVVVMHCAVAARGRLAGNWMFISPAQLLTTA